MEMKSVDVVLHEVKGCVYLEVPAAKLRVVVTHSLVHYQ